MNYKLTVVILNFATREFSPNPLSFIKKKKKVDATEVVFVSESVGFKRFNLNLTRKKNLLSLTSKGNSQELCWSLHGNI